MQQYSEPPLHHANKHQGNLSEQNATVMMLEEPQEEK